MKKILVPTDFSSYADAALKLALKIAEKSGGEIILLNVMLTPEHAQVHANAQTIHIGGADENAYLQQAVEGTRKNLQALIDQLSYKQISYEITSGNITQSIIKQSEKDEIDLIVMGTQGSSNYDAIFVGSNAEKVIRMAECPVITIRELKSTHLEKIVFACDLEDKHAVPVKMIKQLQTWFNSHLHLVYVNTPSDFSTTRELDEKSARFVQNHQLENYTFHVYCDTIEDDGITHFAESVDADLIAVASHKRQGFFRMLTGSVSEGVVNLSHIPVLTLRLT